MIDDTIVFFTLFDCIDNQFFTKQTVLKLWYNSPSGATWENALPVGNGRLGAMVFGNVEKETIQLNEHTVWSGSPNRNDNPEALASIPEIRQLIFDGKQKEAEQLANKTIITKKSHGQMFQPVGSLHLNFTGHDNFTNYYRELDIERAVARTSYTVDNIVYTREIIASLADRLIVIRLTASKSASISFTASYSTPQPKALIQTTPSKELIIRGTTSDHEGVEGKVRFYGITRIKPEGGSLLSNDTSLIIKNADAVTIYVSIATNFNSYKDISGNENERAAAYMHTAHTKSYDKMLSDHIKAYRKYFDRVKFDLGVTDAVKLPTDERLKNFRTSHDPQFQHFTFSMVVTC